MQKEQYYLDYGYENFQDFVEKCLDFKIRKAQYLIAIYNKLNEFKAIKAEDLAKTHWAKVKEILPVVSEKNVKEWLGKASELSLPALKEAVCIAMGKNLEGSYEQIFNLTFPVFPGQKEVIERALEIASRLSSNTKKGQLLEYISAEFLATYDGGDGKEEDDFKTA